MHEHSIPQIRPSEKRCQKSHMVFRSRGVQELICSGFANRGNRVEACLSDSITMASGQLTWEIISAHLGTSVCVWQDTRRSSHPASPSSRRRHLPGSLLVI